MRESLTPLRIYKVLKLCTWMASRCFRLTPLRIYKVLKHIHCLFPESDSLTPLRIYKVLKLLLQVDLLSQGLTPLRIYKVLKPQMVFTEPPLPGLQHKFKGFSESSTCPYQ